MARCVHCAKPISSDEEVCPLCGGEQPVEWMVRLVYVLAFFFVQGAFYRLIWPKAESLLMYAVYFVATLLLAAGVMIVFRRYRKRESSQPEGRRQDALED